MTSARTIVMTGATRGLGRRAVARLLRDPDARVFVLGRASAASAELEAAFHGRAVMIPADFESLRSVGAACSDLVRRIDGTPIDALVLNAGVQRLTGDQATADGIEVHFQVNHLAHVLIADQLAARVARGGRIVITASETHDPDAFCMLGISRATWQDPLDFADARRSQAHVVGDVDRGESRYSVSKLCNVMHARRLAQEHPEISVVSFNPSVVPGTEIARDRNVVQRYLWRTLMPVLSHVLPGVRHIERSAGDLAWLVGEASLAGASGAYFDGRTLQPGSAESRDAAKIARVMEVSRALIADRLAPERSLSQA